MSTKGAKVRADQRVVDLGIAESKTKAQALILAGKIYVGEKRIDKAGDLVASDTSLALRGEEPKYVSRGGVKLEGALASFAVDVRGWRCLDIGASTGGFTDCLLQRGAAFVAAVDVGYGQLAQKLRVDPRVLVLERTNARVLEPAAIGGEVDLVVVDASFIGLGKLVSAMDRCLKPGGRVVALVKPQFELGREEASRGRGVVRDPAVRAQAIARATEEVRAAGFSILGTDDSILAGPKGNLEAFVHAKKPST